MAELAHLNSTQTQPIKQQFELAYRTAPKILTAWWVSYHFQMRYMKHKKSLVGNAHRDWPTDGATD